MNRRTTYRWGSVFGTVAIAASTTAALTYGGASSATATLVSTLVVAVTLAPLFDPQPRRPVEVVELTLKRVTVACLALLGIGALGIVSVPAATQVAILGVVLAVSVPILSTTLRARRGPQRVLVVGDDPTLIEETIRGLPREPVGFVSPMLSATVTETGGVDRTESPTTATEPDRAGEEVMADGGDQHRHVNTLAGIDRLSGLSRLGHVLDERTIDTVVIAFAEADRQECFGVLRVCHDAGVDVLARDEIGNAVREADRVDNLIDVEIEPWPWYSRLAKRAFDIAFATAGLLVLAPLIIAISVAIKLDSPGPVLYGQRRTTELGETFPVWKFRSMVTDAEAEGAQLSDEDAGGIDPRVTRVGRILRETHMDEIPQLVSILVGDMSVVGPRPERPELDQEIENDGVDWSKRWFIKPGLTGIAQVNEVNGFEPGKKLEYDLEYARRQSFWLDIKLVMVQIWGVIRDVLGLVSNQLNHRQEDESMENK